MRLDHIEVVGFRGINRLSINVHELSALLGENSWGKSSLFEALSLFLSGSRKSYHFNLDDFHRPPVSELPIINHIYLVFTFKEQYENEASQRHFKSINDAWVVLPDRKKSIIYQVDGSVDSAGNVFTDRHFLDESGHRKIFPQTILKTLINEFLSFVPVLRMGFEQSHTGQAYRPESDLLNSQRARSEARIKRIFQHLTSSSQQLSELELKNGCDSLAYLFDHYLLKRYGEVNREPNTKQLRYVDHSFSFNALTRFNDLLKDGHKTDRAMLLLVLGQFLEERGEHLFRRGATPILLLEEPENNLHPVNLAITWRFFSLLPMQKLVSTNSSQLLSFFPLSRIQRLVRQTDIIKSYSMNITHYSNNDLRRIAFHLRMNRPQSLFARSWLLVEGETETWLLTELAQLCGYHFLVEGIQVIEFAQCGLKPLIKLAQDLNIEWHTLTDGDSAGQKYASRVKDMLGEHDSLISRLTVLPAHDIEHLFFENGFEDVYLKAANYTKQDLDRLSVSKVIDKAVHKYSKPGLGIAIAEAVESQGAELTPLLLKRLFSRLVGMARSQSG
ncbi:DUF2813 domain-containing protein [Psychromonas sp. RZ22]|uniref:DUF2813 domain-containing protein n=1 Tax=Psychromonas algarum TaxID=2555643 RepID=UPI0010677E3C|nr:DUF2813 domain-containing protein [Psychromonas sp. RZ22]TEW53884.1 DUF2813 domain-containing protein [Psychromonas sp. RZ22]